MRVTVRAATPGDESAWETFVFAHADATFFHRFGWSRVLARGFGHTAHYLLAECDGEIQGVLPLAEVNSWLFGRRLSSLPFCVYGGILAMNEAAERALRDAAAALAGRLRVDALELRGREASASDWPRKELYYTFRKPLDSDHGANLKAIPNRQRAMLRKALAEGLFSEEVEDTRRMYRVYAESVRNLGTPVFGARYLELLQQEFGADCRMMMIRQATDAKALYTATGDAQLQRPPDTQRLAAVSAAAEDVAGVLSFYFRGEVLPYYGGSIGRARNIRGANHFIYWELMRRSVDEGLEGFDFGRSKKDTGPYSFKKNFGFEPQSLPYEYHLVRADKVPDVNPNNPRYQRLVKIWQRLPLPVANTIGPLVARSLG